MESMEENEPRNRGRVTRSTVAPLFYAVASFLLAVIAFVALAGVGIAQHLGIDVQQLLQVAAVITLAIMIGAPIFFILVFVVELTSDR